MGRKSRETIAEEMLADEQGPGFDSEPEDKNIEVLVTSVFERNRDSKKQILVNRGGRGSSKSYSIAQLILHRFFTEDRKRILILRKSLPSLRVSTLEVMKTMAEEYGLMDRITVEKVHLNWYYNSSLIHFGSVDESSKLKSSDWNIVWIEEATELTYDDFMDIKLCMRAKSRDGKLNQMYLSFNPIDEFHWIKKKLVDDPVFDVDEIVSSYKDNPFLPDYYVKDLENLQYQDMSYYNIYTLGNWGRLENIIYTNWATCDWLPGRDTVDTVFYGLDFGFNAETALLRVYAKKPNIWEEELIYDKKMTNSDLIVRLCDIIPADRRRKEIIYADPAEPDRIEEIRRAGFLIKEALKPVTAGIDWVKKYNIHILKSSDNLIKEKRTYSWRKNKNGDVLDEVVEYMNHLMDAERYAIYTAMKKGAGVKVRFLG